MHTNATKIAQIICGKRYLWNKFGIYHFLFLAGLFFSLHIVYLSYQSVEKIAANDNGNIANVILELPSLCTYNTGIFLAKCTSKEDVKPIEDIGCGDLGYPLLANIITYLGVKNSPLTKADLVRINIWLNWIGLIFLAFAMIVADLKWTPILTVFIGAHYFMPQDYPALTANYYSSFFGIFCIALAGVIFFALAHKKNPKNRTVYFFLAFLSFTAALLLREPMGYIGMIGALFISSINFIKENTGWWRKFLRFCVLGLMIYSITLLPLSLTTARTLLWNVPKGQLIPKHGISYTLIMGFGTIPNSWGITRSDETTRVIARNVDPDFVTYSAKQFDILTRVYTKMIIEKPMEMLHIYRTMLSRALTAQTKVMSYYFYILLLSVLILLGAVILKGQSKIHFWIVTSLGICCLLALAQGVLAGVYYAQTAEVGFIVSILMSLEIFMQNIAGKYAYKF